MRLGIQKIEYLPENNCKLVSADASTTAIKMGAIGGELKPLPIVALTATLNVEYSIEAGGVRYDVSIAAKIAGINHSTEELLRLLSRQAFVYVLTDQNGIKYLVGTSAFRAVLTYRLGIDELNRNGYDLTIEHSSPHGALILV